MRNFLLVLILFFLAGMVTSCGKQEHPAGGPAGRPNGGSGKLDVATTILPVADFIKNVGGEKVAVTVLVPPGASVHTYEPTPGQMSALAKSRVYFMVGSGVEFELAWMKKIIENNKNLEVVDCSRGIQLIDLEASGPEGGAEDHGSKDAKNLPPDKEGHKEHQGKDPHIWLSLKNARVMVENVCAGLVQADPANKDYYVRNKENYLRELDQLDREIEESLKKVQKRIFLVFHPAWGYFARDYQLKQIAVEVAGKEPSAKDLAAIIDTAKKEGIRTVFASPQFNPQSAEVIAREIGGQVVFIDPLPENYIQNMRLVVGKF